MSEMQRDVDLAVLARAPKTSAPAPRRRRRLVWIVPLVLVAGFVAVLFSTVGDLLRGSAAIVVVRPRAGDGGEVAAGSAALQRSGWVEPDPFPLFAAALAPGVVRELLVLEGDDVEAGQPVARLVDDDAKVELARAEAALARAQAEARRAKVERDVAQESFDAALEVTEAEAMATAELAGRTAEAERRAAAAREAKSKVRVAEEEFALQQFLAENGGAGPRQVELAQARLDAERAGLAVMEADAALAAAETEKAKARLARASKERELRLADRLRRDSAIAALSVAEAAEREAAAARDGAALVLERRTVRAPGDGGRKLVVLQRMAAPGAMVGVESREAVCSLFDPAALRVRIDVEQSEVAKLAVGQAAKVKAPTRPDRLYDGEVVRVVRLANVEKVTLQVHVKVKEPDAALRPEMLVEVRFLAATPAAKEDAAPNGGGDHAAMNGGPMSSGVVTVPSRLLVKEGGGASAWVVDPLSSRAARRRVEIVREQGEEALVRGLNLSDKVIDVAASPDGARVREGAAVTIASDSAGGGR